MQSFARLCCTFFFNRYNEEKNDDNHKLEEDNYLFKKTLVLLSGRKNLRGKIIKGLAILKSIEYSPADLVTFT